MTSRPPERWADWSDPEAARRALLLALGTGSGYWLDLILGVEAITGSTLKINPRANRRRWGTYERSRKAMLQALTDEGIEWHIRKGGRGRRILVLGPERQTELPIHGIQRSE